MANPRVKSRTLRLWSEVLLALTAVTTLTAATLSEFGFAYAAANTAVLSFALCLASVLVGHRAHDRLREEWRNHRTEQG